MKPAKVMIVEDDRVVARDIRQQLERMGHSVVAMTAEGEHAASLAAGAEAELVLMDIRLRGAVDGVQAAQQVRAQCEIPVIFLTAYADDETIRRASLTEPFGYLLKPFEDAQLRTVVEMALYKSAAERRLRDSERRYAATLASIADAVIAVDDDLRISFMNPKAEALTGWSRAEANGSVLETVLSLADERAGEPLHASGWVGQFRPGSALRTWQALLRGREGQDVPVEATSSPIVDDRGRLSGAVFVFRDLTERRSIEQALRTAEAELARVAQLTQMSELAASIAHEINQPLAAIVSNAGAGLNWLGHQQPDLEETRQVLARIESDGSRAAEVIRSLQALSRKVGPSFTSFDLCELVRCVLDFSRDALQRSAVKVHLDFAEPHIPVRADRVQIQQVLQNLVTNAIDAMAEVAASERRLTVALAFPDAVAGKVTVTVSDTGAGLSQGDALRIFDSFFTTKPHGMGMGLPICRTILEAHHSRLAVGAAPVRGTAFSFDLVRVGQRRPDEEAGAGSLQTR